MSTSPDNQPLTPANPVEVGTPADVIRCLVDWLKENGPSEQKAHRILSALAKESLKAAEHGIDNQLTAEEIAIAAGENPWTYTKSQNEWIDWKDTVETYWNVKKPDVIQFAVNRGLKLYPRPHKNSTSGRYKATYRIVAEPIPENGAQLESVVLSVDSGPIRYEISEPGEVRLSWFARPIFGRGELWLSGWGRWLVLGWMFGTIMGATLLIIAIYFSLMSPRPITTIELALIIAMVGIPTWVWFEVVYPWFRLFDDRIKPASSLALALGEKDAQVEVFRDNDLRVIRFVRYSSTCSICGAAVYLDDGSPDFPRRMVGRCSESPREHIFSFDRVTRMGRVLRGP
jgi:hypothetical protein